MQINTSKKYRLFQIIQIGTKGDKASRLFDLFISVVIILNTAVLFLETFPGMERYTPVLYAIGSITVGIFIIEYILRLWTAQYLFPHEQKAKAILKFIVSWDGIIQLLAILPFFFLTGFIIFRMLRIVRIFHLFKINSHYDSFHVIGSVLYEKRNQILSSIFIIVILIMAASLFMYSFEHEAQPENFKNAFSGIWWSILTIFTIGYGDIYPITFMGKICAVIITFLGVGAVAIPTGIISAGFVEQYTRMQSEDSPNHLNFHTMRITMDSNWIGKSVYDIEKENGILIAVIERDGKQDRPNDTHIIALGDLLTITNPPDQSIR